MTTMTINNNAGNSYMNSDRIRECIEGLNELKKDAAILQKRGLPFMLTSVILWTAIMFSRMFMTDIYKMNFFVFCCSSLLLPFATFFGKLIGADIYRKNGNPVNKLGFLCTMNQMLYLPIAMWAYSAHPDSMLLIYAIIFSAHLLPFSWVYGSRIYYIVSMVETIGVILIAYAFGYVVSTAFVVAMQIIICIFLIRDIKGDKHTVESTD